MAELNFLPVPEELLDLPIGIYGISFDLFTHPIIDPLPNGWGLKSTSPIYKRIRTRLELAGFERVQGSVYQQNDIFALAAWIHMLGLRGVEPMGIFPSSLKAIQIFFIPLPFMITTNNMQLGGEHSPNLTGPTPVNLVPNGVPFIIMDQPPAPLPINVTHNSAHIGANWAAHDGQGGN